MKRTVFFVFLIVILFACHSEHEVDYPVLSVDITKMNVPSVFDIFEKIEIIPLETTDNSLIGGEGVGIIDFYNNHYYILNGSTQSFFCFDEHGKFVRKIGNRGLGPQEYNYITDFIINNNVVELLSPWGFLYVYNLSGRFLNKTSLPMIVDNYQTSLIQDDSIRIFNYQDIMLLNDSIRILTSSVDLNQDMLYVYSTRSNTIINSFYKNNYNIPAQVGKSYYQYNDSIFFYEPIVSKVFRINQYGYEVAYAWDFGAMSPENSRLEKDISSERSFQLFESGQMKGLLNRQFQNENYYFTRSTRIAKLYSNEILHINILYDKRNNRAFVFEKFKEDLTFFPVFWNDEYVLASSHIYLKKAVDFTVLDEENRNKLKAITEDDNPFLIKYYFK